MGSKRIIRIVLNKQTEMEAGLGGQPLTTYYVNLDVGTPPKGYKMLVDINAQETWLPHSLPISFVFNRLHYAKGYSKKGSSSSSKESSKEYDVEYQTCTLTGKAYEDFITFADPVINHQKATLRQRFLAMSSASNGALSDYPTDGVLAMSPALLSNTGTRSLLVNMEQACLIDDLKFSLYLDSNLKNNDGGELTFGGLNPTMFIGNIYYHQVANLHGHWELNLQNVMFGGQVVSCNRLGCTALLSTGVNELYGPPDDVNLIMNLLGISNGDRKPTDEVKEHEIFEIECLRVAELPVLTFNIDGIAYHVPPSMYVKKKVDGIIFKTSTCYVTIFSNTESNQWILGTNFLANYYSTFDINKRQVGFAAKRTNLF